jgi:mRNA interferase MazF
VSGVPFLHAGVFDAQNLVSIPHAKLVRRIGRLLPAHLVPVENAVARWLGLELRKIA